MYDDLEKNLRTMKRIESEPVDEKVNNTDPFQQNMNLHKSLEESTSINGLCERCNCDKNECECNEIADGMQKCTKCSKEFPVKREDGSDYETDLCDTCFAEENPHTSESNDDSKPDGNETTPTPIPKDAKPSGDETTPPAVPADAKPKGNEDEPKNNETPAPEKKAITDVSYPDKTPENLKVENESSDDAKPDGNETTPTPITPDAKPTGDEVTPLPIPPDAKPTGNEDEPKGTDSPQKAPVTDSKVKEDCEGYCDCDGKSSDDGTGHCQTCGKNVKTYDEDAGKDEGKVVDPSAVDPAAAHKDLVEAAKVKIKEMATAKDLKEDVEDKIFFGSRGQESFYVEELKDEQDVLQGMNIYNAVEDLVLNTSDKEYSMEDPALLIQSVVADLGLDAVSFQYMVDLGVLAPPPDDEEITSDAEAPAGEEDAANANTPAAEEDEGEPAPVPAEGEEIKPEDEEEPEETKEAKVADVSQDLDKIKNDLLEKHNLK